MESTQKILLNSSNNKKSTNENMSLRIPLSGNKKLLPEGGITDTLNAYDIYLEERKKSNKFRLTFNINPYCTNVLFNPFTEIVKHEGSSSAICLNYESNYKDKNVVGKSSSFTWSQYDAIRDTQLTNDKCGFDYHCGIDIFNNHILRNKTFKTVTFTSNSKKSLSNLGDVYGVAYGNCIVNNSGASHVYLIEKDFNTIDDYMRDSNGVIISEVIPTNREGNAAGNRMPSMAVFPLHLYQDYDVMSFRESIKENLSDENGWYGFHNASTVLTKNLDSANSYNGSVYFSYLDLNKTINNKNYNDFIDLYPGRDLFSFTPKYNEHRKRVEKNWNYCLTFPSKSVIKNGERDFPFFRIDNSGNTSLKVYMFDEGVVDDDETALVTIYTISQHGLMVGDTVNIYKSGELFYESSEVIHVIDKYIFQIYKTEGNMSNKWVEVTDRYASETITNPLNGKIMKVNKGILTINGVGYPICESNRCNIDENAQDICVRRVVNGVECKYYVRKFSRLPNFKFRDEEINDYTLYDDKHIENDKKKRRVGDTSLSLIDRFSKPGDASCEFESHSAKLGFANTSYNDDITEIVFTDDIDTSYLKDNLGRPLSEIFLTIVKNNKGYKEWYGITKQQSIKNVNVEYSHCFGKVNASFLFSKYYRESYLNSSQLNASLFDVRDITADPNYYSYALYEEAHNVRNKSANYKDEIEFDNDWEYYGDICCYSPVDCDEQTIQYAMHRFNTVQRELKNLNASSYAKFNNGEMRYDEIYDVENNISYGKISSRKGDPYNYFVAGTNNSKPRSEITPNDTNLYHTTKEKFTDMLDFKEGYYYQPHYKIQIKDVSDTLSSDNGVEYEISYIKNTGLTTENNRKLFGIKTVNGNYFQINEKVVLYKRSTNQYFFVTVYDSTDFNTFTCTINDELGNTVINIDGIFDIDNINDYVIIKKHEDTPNYARLIKDGSCRYCWRDIITNGIETTDGAYPFTNGAFYIKKQINFFLRRQDPEKFNLWKKSGFNYVPEGEDIKNYPNFYVDNEINYEANEIEQC